MTSSKFDIFSYLEMARANRRFSDLARGARHCSVNVMVVEQVAHNQCPNQLDNGSQDSRNNRGSTRRVEKLGKPRQFRVRVSGVSGVGTEQQESLWTLARVTQECFQWLFM